MRLRKTSRRAVSTASGRRRATRLAACAAAACALASAAAVAAPAAAAEGPRWAIVASTNPTHIVPESTDAQLIITATNVGGASSDGSPITIEETLPGRLTATTVSGYDAYHSGRAENGEGSAAMTCEASLEPKCTDVGKVDPGDILTMTVHLTDKGSGAGSETNEATVKGGGAAAATAVSKLTISSAPATFGPAPESLFATTSSSQAGAHANVTTAFTLSTSEPNEAAAYPKDVRFDLPPGLVGSVVGIPQCQISRVIEQLQNPNACPADTMVGMATLVLSEGAAHGFNETVIAPIYNIQPDSGEPAAFAFNAFFFPLRLDTSLLSNGDYAVRVTGSGLPQAAETLSTSITFWGIPADHSGPGEDKSFYNVPPFGSGSFGGPSPAQTRAPLLTNPQQCETALSAQMSTDSWSHPGAFVSSGSIPMGTATGCSRLALHTSFSLLPDNLLAGAPAGYALDLQAPQTTDPDGLARPTIRNVKLTLPAGVVVSPSAASGLVACPHAAFFGPHLGAQEPASAAECPRQAQIGTAEVTTPALPFPLKGQVYVGEPKCGPCTPEDAAGGKMVRLYLQVVSNGEGEGESGVVVKLEGQGLIDQASGQITTTFEEDPPLPFSELKVTLNGGGRATLANPRSCGLATSAMDLTPWSSPFSSDSTPTYGFEVNQGCFGPQFSPSLMAGTTNNQAGAYSPFTLALSRGDHDQNLGGLEVQMPPGLLGKLSSLTPCPEPQAGLGTCGPESQVGHLQVLAGPGPEPLSVGGGQVFLTTSYKGAPFGLSVVIPAVAGPYTLAGTTGRGTVVVRETIRIDPSNAHVTISSDPFPTMLDGVPLQIRAANVTIDRNGSGRNEFLFNPTNCSKLAVTATLSSAQGAAASASVPFQAANCAALPFKPKFTVLTQGRTSKANGASLRVKVVSGPGQANIGKVAVSLPKQLPSRLSTLRQACVDRVFNVNPAACPAASLIGTAKAVTPVLESPLTGPAYLVSHGGVAFPDLVIVLQGEGITIYLDGNTRIRKGITSSTFNSVPDAPIGAFELTLPEGPRSVFSANLSAKARGSMCGQALAMPTTITGQNGALLKQSTKIGVSGCAKKAKRSHAGKRAGKARARRGRGVSRARH